MSTNAYIPEEEQKNTTTKTATGVNNGYDTGVYGSAVLQENPYETKWTYRKGEAQQAIKGPDTTRRTDLAGKTAVSGNYTVHYDDRGYAKRATYGVTDYVPHKDYYVGNGTYSGGNLWTDEEILPGADLAAISGYRSAVGNGTMTAEEANRLANDIRANYGYTIDQSGNVYGTGLGLKVRNNRIRQGMPINGITDAQQLYMDIMDQEYNPFEARTSVVAPAAYTAPASTAAPTAPAEAYAAAGAVPTNSSSTISGSTSTPTGGKTDLTKYLEDMYAQNLQAELSALDSTYKANVAELESKNEQIAEQYRSARNQAAAQNQLERQSMNERAAASGLNTGTSGQIALAQSMAHQNNLGNLYAQQNRDQAENQRAMAALLRDYNAGVNQATAASNAQLAQALYNEMIRQEEAAAAQAQFEYQKEMDAKQLALQYAKMGNGGTTNSKPALTWSQVDEAIKAGLDTPNVRAAYEYYMGVPYTAVTSPTQLGVVANNLYTHYSNPTSPTGLTSARKGDLITAYNNGQITEDELNYILNYLGV